MLRHLIAASLLLVTACQPTPDKYPYPPQYVSTQDVPPTSIPAPPAQGSTEYASEVEQIVRIQSTLSPAQIAEIQHQITIAPEVIVLPVLGKQYTEASYPKLYDLLKRVASDSWRIGDDAREYWQSPRPWYTEPRVKRYVEEIRTPGYPSGHTTTFGSWAYVLGDLFPHKKDALLQKAWSVGGNRIAGGAHYPHDIAGGKLLAKAVYDALQSQPAYQQAMDAARDEIAFGSVKLKHGDIHGFCPHKPCHCGHGAKRPQPTVH